MRRVHCTVSIWDDTNTRCIAFFVLYRNGLICLRIDGKSQDCQEWRFLEWFSFALKMGYTIAVQLTDSEMRNTTRTEFTVPRSA